MTVILVVLAVMVGCFLFWRYVWFFRNPPREVPPGECVVSAADGTVVYVKHIMPDQDVIVIKKGVTAKVQDIVRSEVSSPKLLIGIFMSPFDVHHNRAPIAGEIKSISHYPAKGRNVSMFWMHLRTVLRWEPYYINSVHVLENERTVTRIAGAFKGDPVSLYVVQIGGRHVHGIESCLAPGSLVNKGEVFGMIRVGSQVDVVLPQLPGMQVKVQVGDKARAGETVLVE